MTNDEIAAKAGSLGGHPIAHEATYTHNPELSAARFRLQNGLGVVLMVDRRAPVFAYQTWFKVGSRDEDPERTGLAHLFEHLMFKGTARHPVGELDREMELRGSQTNAATWVDWTHYTEALAVRGDNLATVVDFEVDRMTGLLLDEDTFRSELEVVKNERRMAVDDSVTGTLSEHLFDLAYTSHPYRWPTIGSMAHLEAATVDDLRAFYRAYYAPNNATVVLVGDVDPVETLALLARSYGPLERQPITRRTRPAEPVQREARRLEIERPVVAPQLLVGFHAPPQLDDEFTAIEILNDALCAGDSARLYRRLVTDEQIATDVGGYTSPFSEPGLYELHVTARPHADPERVLDVLREELDALASGLEPRELNKARHDLEMGHYEGLHDAESCAENLGHFETNYGDFSLAFRSEERFARVDPGALGRVAGELLRPDNATVVIAKAPAS